MRLKDKFIFATFFIIITSIIFISIGLKRIESVNSSVHLVTNEDMPALLFANQLSKTIQDTQHAIGMGLGGDSSFQEDMKEAKASLQASIENLTVLDEQASEIINDYNAFYDFGLKTSNDLLKEDLNDDSSIEKLSKMRQDLLKHISQYKEFKHQSFLNSMESISVKTRQLFNSLEANFVILIVFFLISFFYLRSHIKSIKNLEITAIKLANLDLNTKVIKDRNDELGVFQASFEKMRLSLKNNIENLDEIVSLRTQELSFQKQKAENAVEEKDAFLANMSHEIRTPMNGVLGFSKLLNDTELTSEQKEYIDLIDSSTQSLLVVINDILDFSKISSKKMSLEKIDLNFNKLVEEVMRLMKNNANEKGLDLILNIDSNIEIYFKGDPVRLRQILINLISNSIKFTEKGKVEVKVKLNAENDPALLYVSVIDTGIGMTPKQIKNVFERFHQADMSTTRVYGGTGLGTTIVKHLVTLMNGDINCQSEYKKGCTFNFSIPVELSEFDEETKSIKLDLNRDYQKTVLLAEDNPINQKLAIKILSKLGITTVLAKNGEEVLDLAMREEHDLILMDIQMPVMDGIIANRKLNEQGYGKKVIPMTANVTVNDLEKYKQEGFTGLISKPIDIKEMIEQLDPYLL